MNRILFRARARKFAIAFAGTTTLLIGGIGLLHTSSWGRSTLAKVAGCPIETSPVVLEQMRMTATKATRGGVQSPARPALGFALDEMSAEQAEAWADEHHVDCDSQRRGTLLVCKHVDGALVREPGAPSIDELALEFSPDKSRLVNVSTFRSGLSAVEATISYNQLSHQLEGTLGNPTTSSGDANVGQMASAMNVSGVSYRFQDYEAQVTAVSIPDHGVALREHFMSARD